jgi:four helix bundle protein
MLHFQKLDVYRCSIEFLAFCRKVRDSLPRGTGDLADQVKRASQSITQNIAEGAGKSSLPDRARFFTIARGSATECAAHLDVLQVEGLLASERYTEGLALLERIVSMLTRMIDP